MTTETSGPLFDTSVPALLSVDDIAALCECSRGTIRRWIRQGDIPAPVRISRRLLRFRVDDIREWVAAGCPTSNTTVPLAPASPCKFFPSEE